MFERFCNEHQKNIQMSRRKGEGDKDAHRQSLHCLRAKLTNYSFFFSFSFFKFMTCRDILGPCWDGDGCAGAAALQFLPALQSHPGRGIMKRPALPRSPATVSCKHLILYLSFIFVSLPLPCVGLFLSTFSFFLSSNIFCFRFDLHNNLPLSSYIVRDEQSSRKGSSLRNQNYDQLFVIPAESQTKFTDRH